MKKEIVTIRKVDQFGVVFDSHIGADIEHFPGAEVGQVWEVITQDNDPNFPGMFFGLGSIVSTRLISGTKE